MPDSLFNLQSFFNYYGYNETSTEVLSLLKDDPYQSYTATSIPTDLSQYYLIFAQNFNYSIDQKPVVEPRRAGESFEPSTFMVPNVTLKSQVTFPYIQPSLGFFDFIFDIIWDICKYSVYGTRTIAKSNIKNIDNGLNSGVNSFFITNVSEFFPFINQNIIIKDETHSQSVNIRSLEKNGNIVITPLESNFSSKSILIGITQRNEDINEPSFSLISSREGILYPTLVDKLSISISPNKPVTITADFSSLNINRNLQTDFRNKIPDLLSFNEKRYRDSYILDGSISKFIPLSATNRKFELNSVKGDVLFQGFQTLDIPESLITSIDFTVENKLEEVYCLHSLLKDLSDRRRENSFPYALFSNGRTISGSIKYKHTIEPLAFAERLCGPSGINGNGFALEFGNCKISFPNIVWSPSSSIGEIGEDSTTERTLNWSFISDSYISMPALEYIGDY